MYKRQALRTVLSVILACQIGVYALAADSIGLGFFDHFEGGSDRPRYGAGVAVYLLMPLLWLVYALVPLGKVHPSFRSVDEGGALSGDTEGIHYGDVVKLKGYEMAPYICPRITERIYESTKVARRQLQQTASRGAPAAALPKFFSFKNK